MPDIVGRLKPPRLSSPPASPTVGEEYYDTGANVLYWWNGQVWVSSGAAMQPASQARAYRNTALPISSATWTKIPVDTLSHDASGSAMSVATGRYNCPTGGYYQVSGEVALTGLGSSVTAQARIAIYKNGSLITSGVQAATSDPTGITQVAIGDVVQCNAGDYLELWAYSAAAGSLLIGSNFNYLSVSLIGTAPVAAPSYAARAYRNAAWTSSTSWAKLPIDTVNYDPSGCFQLANNRYVCPVSGTYDVAAAVGFNVSATGTYTPTYISIYKNGVQVDGVLNASAVMNYSVATIADKIQCNAGDYLEVWCLNNQGTALLSGGVYNFLAVSLLTQAPAPLPVTVPPVITSGGLPSNPVDGQECYYVADATNGVVWHLKYRAGSASTHKWECVGGSGLFAGPSGSITTTSTSFVALTSGPSITLALPGDYEVVFGAHVALNAAANIGLSVITTVNGVTFGNVVRFDGTASGQSTNLTAESLGPNVNAGDVIALGVANSNANSCIYNNGWLRITPRRVG